MPRDGPPARGTLSWPDPGREFVLAAAAEDETVMDNSEDKYVGLLMCPRGSVTESDSLFLLKTPLRWLTASRPVTRSEFSKQERKQLKQQIAKALAHGVVLDTSDRIKGLAATREAIEDSDAAETGAETKTVAAALLCPVAAPGLLAAVPAGAHVAVQLPRALPRPLQQRTAARIILVFSQVMVWMPTSL